MEYKKLSLMEQLRFNEKRAKLAILLIWFSMAADILSFISGYLQHDLLTDAANGVAVTIEGAQANDSREKFMGIVSLCVFVISGITFIQWFRRAYYNLQSRVNYLEFSEGWAAGSWFVPIVSLYKPYHMMLELYRRTDDYLDEKKIKINTAFSTRFIGTWWALWILNNLVGQYVLRSSLSSKSIDELTSLTTASMISNVIGIPLAIITVKVISDYAKVEKVLYDYKEEVEKEIDLNDEINLTNEISE